MATEEINKYYSETINRTVREDLIIATDLVGSDKIALDCGCGAGTDISFLRAKGFIVYAFDIEEQSINICREQFKHDEKVFLSQDSFSSYDYPKSTLINADASLFYCTETEFSSVWDNIYDSLQPDGIFCGSFLGPDDQMAKPDYNKQAYWSDVMVFEESELRLKLKRFELIKFAEHNISGLTPTGAPHRWHIYSVVAKKI